MSAKRKPDPTGGDLDLSSVGPGLEHSLRVFTAAGVLQKVPCVLDWMEGRGITVVISVEGDTWRKPSCAVKDRGTGNSRLAYHASVEQWDQLMPLF